MSYVDETSKSRLSIFVPSPKARINLGQWQAEGANAPFGYTGMSLQSDVHLFIDANKHTIFQTGKTDMGQVGAKWLQYSSGPMFMATTASATLAASDKVLLAAGAGHGQITCIDHGDEPRPVNYNNLELHYRTEEVQNGLLEFFGGRRKRKDPPAWLQGNWSRLAKVERAFDTGGNAADEDEETADLQKGFAAVAEASWAELFEDRPGAVCGDLVGAKVIGAVDAANTKYGYGTYFARFDPYKMINPSAIDEKNPIKKGALVILANCNNALVWAKRTADLVAKIGNLLTDNAIGKVAQNLAGAVDNAFAGAHSAMNIVAGVEKTAKGGGDQFSDESKSGVEARAGTVADLEGTKEKAAVRSNVWADETSGFGGDAPIEGDRIFVYADQLTAGAATPPLTAALASHATTPAALATHFAGQPAFAGKVEFAVEHDQLVVRSTKKGVGSWVRVGWWCNTSSVESGRSQLAAKLGLANKRKDVTQHDANVKDFRNAEVANHELQKLPEDTRNLLRPVVNGVNDVVNAANSALEAVKSLAAAVGISLPGPPKAIGLVAKEGISLGTPDKVVAAGGQGVVLVADGGTGQRDHAKFIPLMEAGMSAILEADLWEPYKEEDFGVSLGVRAYSDTTVDMVGRFSAQLLALGRAKHADDKVRGAGIARVAGSKAAEICGHEKVVISARRAQSDDDVGGRVELMGQTIAIGGVTNDTSQLSDFAGSPAERFGVHFRDVTADQLLGTAKFTSKAAEQTDANTKRVGSLTALAWPDALAASHPRTDHVLTHAAKQACIVVGTYMVEVLEGEGHDKDLVAKRQKAVDDCQANIDALAMRKQNADGLKTRADQLGTDYPNNPSVVDLARRVGEWVDEVARLQTRANEAKSTADQQLTEAQNLEWTKGGGVIISVRKPAGSHVNEPEPEKPIIVLNDKEVTIATKAGKDDEGARITLDENGVTILVGKESGLTIKDGEVIIGGKKGKAGKFDANGFSGEGGTLDFSKATQVKLG